MFDELSGFLSNLVDDHLPSGNGVLFAFFVERVFVLEAVVGEMYHKVVFVFDILLMILFNSESQVAWMKEGE